MAELGALQRVEVFPQAVHQFQFARRIFEDLLVIGYALVGNLEDRVNAVPYRNADQEINSDQNPPCGQLKR